ncbi:MAG TPA: Fe-S protein assembly co-chaperone HscB [Sphingobacteriaceae bacterium]|nr:Fe-S protein assembly co-chaperone HscB [Sphingobacteriaceae bacterium]
MNYFELYGIEESFDADQALVKHKFYELSKLYHPDFYINEPEEKQQEILELSTLNNKAYQVLSDKRKTTEYILKLHGLVGEGEKHQLPPEFLMDMMDVNEALMELEFEPDTEKLAEIRSQVEEKMKELETEFKSLSGRYASESSKDEILQQILDLWHRQKYLLRIKDSLSKFVA